MRDRAPPPRILTPPTYAQRGSPTYEPYRPEQRYGSMGMGVWRYESVCVQESVQFPFQQSR